MVRAIPVVTALLLATIAPLAHADIVYQQTMDATWLASNATFYPGTRPYTTSLPNYIDFTAGSVEMGKLLEVPLAAPGTLTTARNYTLNLTADVAPISTDSDFALGLSDGTQFVGLARIDNDGGRVDVTQGTIGADRLTSGGYVSVIATGLGLPNVYDVEVVASGKPQVSATYTSGTYTGNATVALDVSQGLSLVALGGNATETYRMNSLDVTLSVPGGDEILHYSFDTADTTATTATDLSQNGNDGAIGGIPNSLPGAFGEALQFAAGDYVTVGKPLLSQSDANQPYTIAAWVKSDTGSGGGLFSQYPGNPNAQRFCLRTDPSGGRPTWWAGDSGDRAVSTTAVNADTDWHHVVMTKDASQNLTVYVDGADTTDATKPNTHTTAFTDANTEIGRFSATVINDFRGSIDEVWVLDRAISQPEARDLLLFNTLQPDPHRAILHYSFDTPTLSGTANGSSVADLSPLAHHGTIDGTGISQVTTGAPFGEALAFTSGSAVDVGDALLSTTDAYQPYTIAFWLRGTSGGGPFSQYNPSVLERFGIRTDQNSGRPSWWSGGASGTDTDLVASTTTVNDGVWHHVAFTKDEFQNLRVYVDGDDETPAGTWIHPDAFVDQPTRIGHFTNTILPYTGQIDEVWIFAAALNETEIKHLYTLNNPIPEPTTLTLLALGLLAAHTRRRRTR